MMARMDRMDRRALGTFLRSRRERLTPAQVGLRGEGMRRTPGLRREEVAGLACISLEHYGRLEQARGAAPSRCVLIALADALLLDRDERQHLLTLAGHTTETAPNPPRDVPQSILDLLGRVPGTAALVLDAGYDVLAWNPLAAALLEDYAALPPGGRNLIRRHFLPPADLRRHYGMSGADEFSRFAVGRLRSATARYPTDRYLAALVAHLHAHSSEFAVLWDTGDVPVGQHRTKSVDHPTAGHLDLTCDVLTVPDRDQHLVLLTAAPGSPSEQALHRLTATGARATALVSSPAPVIAFP